MTKEAILYEKLPNDKVICTACARYCELGKDQVGLCGIRGNENGKLQLYVYGKVIAGHVDPIEKKPVTHYQIVWDKGCSTFERLGRTFFIASTKSFCEILISLTD